MPRKYGTNAVIRILKEIYWIVICSGKNAVFHRFSGDNQMIILTDDKVPNELRKRVGYN